MASLKKFVGLRYLFCLFAWAAIVRSLLIKLLGCKMRYYVLEINRFSFIKH